jgi:YD repeat-containing protein
MRPPSRWRLPDGTPVAYFGYDWDAASRIVAVQREAGMAVYYAYDDADRLTGERWYNGSSQIYGFAWDYDPVGNRTKEAREHEGTVGYYTYNAANALTQEHLLPADEHSYWRYDERGNCIEVESPLGTTYYTYNSRDLVTSIRWRTGVMNYFHYDAQGRRYAITESAGTTYLTYDQDGLFTLAERDASGNLVAGNTRGYGAIGGIGDRALGEVHSGGTTSRRYDCAGLTGNNVAFINALAQVTGRLEYNAFGELLRYEPPTEGLRFGYSGPAWRFLPDDPDRKTWITKTRWYDAKAGRFGQRDPIVRLLAQVRSRDGRVIEMAATTHAQGTIQTYALGLGCLPACSDAAGLWGTAAEHADITHLAFLKGAPAALIRDPCTDALLDILDEANSKQDNMAGQKHNEYHYNSAVGGDPLKAHQDADDAYAAFVAGQLRALADMPPQPDKSSCTESLKALGRLSHAWQDFFAHAVLRESRDKPFQAWVKGIRGDPENRSNFWPSSYHMILPSEHPWSEPSKPKTPEYNARYTAATEYLQGKYSSLLPSWLAACGCHFCKGAS